RAFSVRFFGLWSDFWPFVVLLEDLPYLLAWDLPNGFQLFRSLGFVCVTYTTALMLPFKIVVPRLQVIYPTDRLILLITLISLITLIPIITFIMIILLIML